MLLEIENLGISFSTRRGQVEAIRGMSFNLEQGETIGIVGESGCGKSITNLAIMGLLPHNANVTADKLQLNSTELLTLSESKMQKLRGGDVAMIFQDPMSALNPSFTVGDQIDETLKIHTDLDKKNRYEKSLELLSQVGIPAPEERLTTYPHELSGGMAQRVMIAMAISCSPKLLIADEPTTALDVTIQAQILELLKDLQKKNNMGMILVTHDLAVVANNTDQIQVMYAGEIVERGPASKIINQAQHPYTSGLLKSLPGNTVTQFRRPLPCIAGLVPDLLNRPSGCQFSPRCEYKSEACKKTPELTKLGDSKNRVISCHHPLGTSI